MKLFSNMSLYRSFVTVSSKKNGPMITLIEIAVHINFCCVIFFLVQCVRKFPRPESNVLFIDTTI